MLLFLFLLSSRAVLLKFLFLSTWGDSHYVGLNGLELYDHRGELIPVRLSQVCAVPSSLNDLHPTSADTRTVDKLFDGVNDTWDDRHMWLSPILPSAQPGGHPRNVLYVYFDAAVALAAIKLWNYSKTTTRGVQAMQVLMDDVIIWDGVLKPAPVRSSVGAPPPPFAQTMLFCAHPALLAQEKENLYRDGVDGRVECLLVNERQFLTQPSTFDAPIIPHGRTHAQVTQANSGKPGAPRPQTMARGQ